jgi:hypothetical protein
MTPTQLLKDLESRGVKLSIRKGQLFVSKSVSIEDRERIAQSKIGLVTVLTHQCAECNQPLRTRVDREGVSWLECPTDTAHFGERLGKLEKLTCPGDDCTQEIEVADGAGWCPKHKMEITLVAKSQN